MTELKLNLNEWQDFFIFSDTKHTALFNEFGSGKTTAGIVKLKKIVDENPGIVGIVLRNINDELKTSTIPLFFEVVFGDRINPTPDVYYNRTDRHLVFPNKSELWFIALDNEKAMRKLKNMVIGVLFGDQGEELERNIWTLGLGRLRQPNMPNCSVLVGNPEGGDHWIKDMYYSDETNVKRGEIDGYKCQWGYWQGIDEDFVGVMAKPKANEYNLEPNYYNDLIKVNSNSWVLKYVYAQWVGNIGLIYPFGDDCIVDERDEFNISELSDFDIMFQGFDYSISETGKMVCLWIIKRLEQTDKGAEYIYYVVNEYYESIKGIRHICDYVKQVDNDVFDVKPKFRVGCPRLFASESDVNNQPKKPIFLFDQFGVKNIEQYRILFDVRQPIIEKLFEDGRLKVFRRCTNLINELKKYKWKNIKTAADHAIEALERSISKAELMKRSKKKPQEPDKKNKPIMAGVDKEMF